MLDGYCNGSGMACAYVKLIDEKCHYECIRLVSLYVEVEKAPYKSWDEDDGGLFKRPCEDFEPTLAEKITAPYDNEFKEIDVITGKFTYTYPEHVRVKEIIEVVVDNDIEPNLDTFVDEKWETYMETKAEEQMEKQWLERQGK